MVNPVLIAKAKESAVLALLACSRAACGADLTIRLPNTPSISRQTVRYQCGANGTSIGVPLGIFSVEYINAGGNSLVAVPISGNTLLSPRRGRRHRGLLHRTATHVVGRQRLMQTVRGSLNGKIQFACRRLNPHQAQQRPLQT